ncbi:P2X purinoceptor 4 isoform X2 [Folsomia candida]|uniref:P2X purinoceptor 4 isoform X2 n=1 Tax=Folsomia candida TaxID=158441 RepID=UPI001604F1B8|nr:P2X purinoceptor 4 isoform X2 [Folsomia candida]
MTTTDSAKAKCTLDKDCVKGKTGPSYDGVLTGKCFKDSGQCEMSSWCPVESSSLPLKGNRALLKDVANFTVLIKNSVEFPECGKDLHYRNIKNKSSSDYLEKCLHSVGEDDHCPILRLGDVVTWSGEDFSKVATLGALFKIELKWECDFDGLTSNVCFPKYIFERMDEANSSIAPGFNFRTSFYHEENRRTLVKMYGIKFLIVVSGQGKKFDFLQLVLAFGANIALFDLAPLVCDTLFHFLCYLKRFTPFKKHFGDFSSKARYADRSLAEDEPEQG